MTRANAIFLLGLIGLLSHTIQAVMMEPSIATAHAVGSSQHDADVGRASYVGDATCISCHKKQGMSYQHTSHYLTSQPANKESVLGSFRENSNLLTIVDPTTSAEPGLYFKMEEKDGGYYETAVTGWGKQMQARTERID